MRGPGDEVVEQLNQVQEYKNCILTFGCPPRKGVPGASTIAVEYFAMLRQIADPADGTVRLPGDRFYRWSPGGIGEHILLTNDDLYLKYAKWKPVKAAKEEKKLGVFSDIKAPEQMTSVT